MDRACVVNCCERQANRGTIEGSSICGNAPSDTCMHHLCRHKSPKFIPTTPHLLLHMEQELRLGVANELYLPLARKIFTICEIWCLY